MKQRIRMWQPRRRDVFVVIAAGIVVIGWFIVIVTLIVGGLYGP